METRLIFVIVLVFGISLDYVQSEYVDDPATIHCMTCICFSTSSCNYKEKGCNGDACGPFRITPSYWADAGKPTFENIDTEKDGGHRKCAFNPYCSLYVIREYMRRNKRDCNGDGRITCDDFARIHYWGTDGCLENDLPYSQKQVFEFCKQKFNVTDV